VLGLALLLYGLTAYWVSVDGRPPMWDQANHLERAFKCREHLAAPGWDLWTRISGISGIYPPLVHCVTGLVALVAPMHELITQLVTHFFLAVALLSTYAIGRALWGPAAGFFAALLLGVAPHLLVESKFFLLDLPLVGLVALGLLASLRCHGFSHRGWSVLLGFTAGAGLLTKWSWLIYMLPALCGPLFEWRSAADRRRRLGNAILTVAVATALALPWYLPRLIDLPYALVTRAYKHGAQEGDPMVLSQASLTYYLKMLVPQAGPLTVILLAVALGLMVWVGRQGLAKSGVMLVSWLFPLIVFTLLRNKDLRYLMPALPAVALLAASSIPTVFRSTWARAAIVALACLQALVVSLGVPEILTRAAIGAHPLLLVSPPAPPVWPVEEALAAIARHADGRASVVSVVPNYAYFSASNFRYYALRDRLPLQVVRAWDVYPIGVDYVVTKSGDQGPEFSIAKAARIMQRISTDQATFDRAFPVIETLQLPDGSEGIIRARQVAPLLDRSAAQLARGFEAAFEKLVDGYSREREGFTVRLTYEQDALRQGRIDRIDLEARSALVGEFARKRPPLRLHEISATLSGVLVNPHRLVSHGEIELLDLGRLAVNHLVITEESLRDFLTSQKGLGGVRFHLEDGAAAGSYSRGPIRFVGRVRVTTAPLELGLFRVEILEANVSGVGLPKSVAQWFLTRYVPTRRLSALPVEVQLGVLELKPGRVEFKQAVEKGPSAALASSLVVATYISVRLTPRFLAALHLDLFEQPGQVGCFSTLYRSRHAT